MSTARSSTRTISMLAWYEALRQQGAELPVWRIHRHIGMGADKIVAALTDEAFEDEHGDAVRAAEEALYLVAMRGVAPLPGAGDLIAELRRRGHRIVLASSAKAREAGARCVYDSIQALAADLDATPLGGA
jgi:beta-phosphoglucomutase-like phosphatase (HAD superfamily)